MLNKRAVQGGRRYARARRQSRIPTASHALATFSGGGSWAEPLLQTAPRRIGFGSPPALFRRWEPFPNAMHRVWGPIPTEAVRFRASPSGFRPPPLVPGLFWFLARVILLTDGPTRPIQRPAVRGQTRTVPHPEPPLLFSSSGDHFCNRPCIWSQSANRPAHVSQGRFCLFMPKPCPPFAYTCSSAGFLAAAQAW